MNTGFEQESGFSARRYQSMDVLLFLGETIVQTYIYDSAFPDRGVHATPKNFLGIPRPRPNTKAIALL